MLSVDCLGVPDLGVPADLDDLLPNLDQPGVQVDVFPPQSAGFAAALEQVGGGAQVVLLRGQPLPQPRLKRGVDLDGLADDDAPPQLIRIR